MKFLLAKEAYSEIKEKLSHSEEIYILSPFINLSEMLDYIKTDKVRIATNFTPEIFEKGSSNIEFFVKASTRNFEIRYIKDLHAKIYLFDDCVILGSSNFTYGGLDKNIEANVCIYKNENEMEFNRIKREVLTLYEKAPLVKESEIENIKKKLVEKKIDFKKVQIKRAIAKFTSENQIILLPNLVSEIVDEKVKAVRIKHENFKDSFNQLCKELCESNYQYISADSYHKLIVWIYPKSEKSTYKNASAPAKELSKFLFGYEVPARICDINYRNVKTIYNIDRQKLKTFHEKKMLSEE